jgi:hypothetical protein
MYQKTNQKSLLVGCCVGLAGALLNLRLLPPCVWVGATPAG